MAQEYKTVICFFVLKIISCASRGDWYWWSDLLAAALVPSGGVVAGFSVYARSQWSVPVQYSQLPIAVDPDLAEDEGDRACQEEELARVLPLWCLCAGRRFRELVRIHMQIRDVTDVVHVDKDDLDVG